MKKILMTLVISQVILMPFFSQESENQADTAQVQNEQVVPSVSAENNKSEKQLKKERLEQEKLEKKRQKEEKIRLQKEAKEKAREEARIKKEEERLKAEKKKKLEKAKKVKFNDVAYRSAVGSGDFENALFMLESVKKPDIALELDRGMLLHFLGEYLMASEKMESTTTAIDDAFTKSIMASFASATLNENISSYTGNIYEYLLVDAFNALNYYNMGDVESALSRVNRVGDKQREYAAKYGEIALRDDSSAKDEKDVADSLSKMNARVNPDEFLPPKPTEKNLYKTSPFADYLQIVLAAQNGSYVDDFIVRELKTVAPQVSCESADLKGNKGRVEVLALTGSIAQRHSIPGIDSEGRPIINSIDFDPKKIAINPNQGLYINTYIPFGGFPVFLKYDWPVFDRDSIQSNVTVSNVTLISKDGVRSEIPVLLEDFDMDCENDVAVRARKAARRSITRSTITKITAYLSSYAIVEAAKSRSELAAALAEVASIPALNAIDLKEIADVRQCVAFPSKAYCAGFTCEPGVYQVEVKYSDGRIDRIDNVVVKKGKPVLVESMGCRAVPVDEGK
ncbi:MAG: hypothetical protein PUJ70_04705 [Treponema sp.]|nr:hypothetical protein [Treponema sp.]MDY5837664.1 hypothetical protein [Treponema sp.]